MRTPALLKHAAPRSGGNLRCRTLIAIAPLLWLSGMGPAESEQLLEPHEIAQDVDQLVGNLSTTHPDLAYTADMRAVQQKARSLVAELSDPMNIRAAWMHMAQLNPLFADAHAGLQFPTVAFSEYRDAGGAVIPIPLYIDATNAVRIAESAGLPSLVQAHEEVVAINARSMADFLAAALPRMRGETDAIRRLVLAHNFAAYYWTVNGAQSKYQATIRSSAGVIREVPLPITSSLPETDAPAQAFAFSQLRSGIGYLQIRSFDPRLAEPFRRFLSDSFAEMKQRRVDRLIIDIRNNHGGAHELSDELLRYLIDRPVRQASALRARITEANRSIAPAAALNEVVELEYDEWLQPDDTRDRFQGQVQLLIGRTTYSQAIVFAATFQDFELGQVIGATTDGWANQTGQVQMTPLSHSELLAAAPLYIIYRPSGDRSPGGIQPDIVVPEDGNDPDKTLKVAINLSRHRSQQPEP